MGLHRCISVMYLSVTREPSSVTGNDYYSTSSRLLNRSHIIVFNPLLIFVLELCVFIYTYFFTSLSTTVDVRWCVILGQVETSPDILLRTSDSVLTVF